MASALKKLKVQRDQFTTDGVRLFNATKEHGTVYADGFIEVKFIQEYEGREIHYRGDGTPLGYKLGAPLPKFIDEVEQENRELKDRIKDLEDSQRRTNELMERLSAQLAQQNPNSKGEVPTTGQLDIKAEAPARGAAKPK